MRDYFSFLLVGALTGVFSIAIIQSSSYLAPEYFSQYQWLIYLLVYLSSSVVSFVVLTLGVFGGELRRMRRLPAYLCWTLTIAVVSSWLAVLIFECLYGVVWLRSYFIESLAPVIAVLLLSPITFLGSRKLLA
ncbi:hypothetical protein JF535_08240 [Microbulbifer salipaludis]|uniref:Histidine kinase N-terminal 7TM region domain-containing protein n=1 Tax=Microbulbifer salipaludis TaxID=187980 RepID=A0ABS3E6A9_9GAMM|nr:hypothetical protein [Microbulbifer salipaludis]MBN8430840.1 hypothetical protein [Microbulbifer salipaludis]